MGTGPTAAPTFEEFQARLPRFEDSWIVEGDIPIHDENELHQYYLNRVAGPASGVGTTEQALVIGIGGTNVNGLNLVPKGRRNKMTYCVSNDFGPDKADVVAHMEAAASAWEHVIAVNFVYDPTQDGNCTGTNDNVWFNVRLVVGAPFGVSSFFPEYPRSRRQLLIDSLYMGFLGDGAIKHALGHPLGFLTEHSHDDSTAGCDDDVPSYQPVPYDTESVMHWPSWSPCPGANENYAISHLDRIAAQAVYGPPTTRCSVIDNENCYTRGGQCEPTFSVTAARGDLCRWSSITSPAACEAPTRRGTWTTLASGFDDIWPTAIPDGASAACITQMDEIGCSVDDEARCALVGAACERALDTAGVRNDLCRWFESTSAADCPSPGIWTPKGSPFAQSHPTAVGLHPADKAGACIAEVADLP